MNHRNFAGWLLASWLLSATACSLLVDATEVDAGCPAGQKWCDGSCVPNTNAAYGCKWNRCLPCELSNAIPRCQDEQCVVAACLFGFGCPGATGCLINVLVDRNNCGVCGNQCNAPCRNAECVVTECDPGFADCDPERDGCETPASGEAACGGD